VPVSGREPPAEPGSRKSRYAHYMTSIAPGRPGRPAAATREDAIGLATGRFLAGERVDVQAIAKQLGLARATIHRWFGTREGLLGELLANMAETRIAEIRRKTPRNGARGLLEIFDRFNRDLTRTPGMRVLLEQEQERALRILTSSGGIVQPRIVAAVERLIEDEVTAGHFAPTVSPAVLAYAMVRLGEAFLYNDAIIGIRGDTDRLREIEAALLGVSRPVRV
jgi:AcrR family transcriptional regulator